MHRNCRNEHFQANMSLYDFLKFKISILSENDDVCTSDKFSDVLQNERSVLSHDWHQSFPCKGRE